MASQLFAPLQQALALHHAGRLQEAEDGYRRILAVDPQQAEAWHYLGVLQAQRGDHQGAVAALAKALAINDTAALAHFHLGESLRQLARYDEALASYDRAIALRPDFAPAHDMRCGTLAELRRFADALAASADLVALMPQRPEGYARRGNALLGLGDYDGALKAFDRALALDPRGVIALNGRGCALEALGRSEEAVLTFRNAAAVMPDFFEAFDNLGNSLGKLGRHEEALGAYGRALALHPGATETGFHLALALMETNRLEAAASAFDKVARLDPAHGLAASFGFFMRAQLCDWSARASRIADLRQRIAEGERCVVHPLLAAIDDPDLHRKAAEAMAIPSREGVAHAAHAGGRLRIAYLSSDFHDHPVAHQIVELLERHDRTRFEIIAVCLKDGPDSAIRRRLKSAADHFVEAGRLSDGETARRLVEAGIAIAVDLNGLTHAARPEILALRPAPIAVSYLGYPGTQGSGAIDYILADPVAIPPGTDGFYTERVARLPHCFFPADTTQPVQAPSSRAEEGLPQDGFVFCAFNGAYKIAPEIFGVWMRLLKAVDGSVLWLNLGNPTAKKNLQTEAEARGVEPGRLVFATRKEDRAAHFARLTLADLFLDTAPYGAHSTANNFLWACVPIVTLAGKSLAARVAASQLLALGMPELIAQDLASYEALALELARSPAALLGLREKLKHNRTRHPLFDMAGLCSAVEKAYETMWRRHAAGLPPEAFDLAREMG